MKSENREGQDNIGRDETGDALISDLIDIIEQSLVTLRSQDGKGALEIINELERTKLALQARSKRKLV